MRLTESLFTLDKLKPLLDKKDSDSNTIQIETKKKQQTKPIAVLDIGTSKICCMIAIIDLKTNTPVEIIGQAHHASDGIRNGNVIDLKAVEYAVGSVIQTAENMARSRMNGQDLQNIFVNMPALYTKPYHFSVDVQISGQQITERDIDSAINQARHVASPKEESIIHVIPASYSVDRQTGIKVPIGMFGHHMGVDISTITASKPALQNFTTAVTANHLDVFGFCASPYASGLSCLVEDEKNLGCTVIDMGAGTSQIAVFFEGALIYTGAIPVGGQHVTNDIARGLTTSVTDAERLKILYGSTTNIGHGDHDTIDVTAVGEDDSVNTKKVPRSLLTGIIQPRIEETFELIRAKLNDEGLSQVAGRRVVLTGGASQLLGIQDLAKHVLDKQVRLGKPSVIKGLAESTGGPVFATALGMLQYAAEYVDHQATTRPASRIANLHLPDNILRKAASWFKENW